MSIDGSYEYYLLIVVLVCCYSCIFPLPPPYWYTQRCCCRGRYATRVLSSNDRCVRTTGCLQLTVVVGRRHPRKQQFRFIADGADTLRATDAMKSFTAIVLLEIVSAPHPKRNAFRPKFTRLSVSSWYAQNRHRVKRTCGPRRNRRVSWRFCRPKAKAISSASNRC